MKKVILVIGFVMCLLLVQAQTRRQMGGVYCAYPFTEVETGKTLSIEKYEESVATYDWQCPDAEELLISTVYHHYPEHYPILAIRFSLPFFLKE